MTIYAGLDVSDKTTHICVVDSDGAVLRRDVVASDPDVPAKWFERYCNDLEPVVRETGPLPTVPYHGLKEREVPVDCICARHAKGVLATCVNKSDVHDAEGMVQLARMEAADRRSQRQQARQDRSWPQAHSATSSAVVERDGVPLDMTPATLFPISHASAISSGP